MSWLLLATLGQFLNAIVSILDKYIVSDEEVLPKPFVYAFYTCIFTSFWVVIYLFGFIPFLSNLGVPSFSEVTFPELGTVAMAFLAAYTFFIALVSMYDALKRSHASSAMPIIGSVSALSTFGLSYLFLDVALNDNFVIGVILLATGTLLVAQTLPKFDVVLQVFHSGLFFALHFITMKALFDLTSFADGFFWSRISFLLFGLSLLLVPAYLDKIKKQTSNTTKKTGFIVLANKMIAGIAGFMLLKATDLGDVSVVQAMEGLRYVFILLLTIAFANWLPDAASNNDVRPKAFVRTILYLVVIMTGFIVLFI